MRANQNFMPGPCFLYELNCYLMSLCRCDFFIRRKRLREVIKIHSALLMIYCFGCYEFCVSFFTDAVNSGDKFSAGIHIKSFLLLQTIINNTSHCTRALFCCRQCI